LVVAVLVFFAAILQAGQSFLNDRPWFWGSALLAAAALNWKIGTLAGLGERWRAFTCPNLAELERDEIAGDARPVLCRDRRPVMRLSSGQPQRRRAARALHQAYGRFATPR
jgi:hypothetical protein